MVFIDVKEAVVDVLMFDVVDVFEELVIGLYVIVVAEANEVLDIFVELKV